ncbi:hypothetical protein MHK_004286 [Candidatus Magnetomorum sp. HK-1]|nr:hypothetical protein MHK_004286 [Candidatus Magnetomorum sp. HK-1]
MNGNLKLLSIYTQSFKEVNTLVSNINETSSPEDNNKIAGFVVYKIKPDRSAHKVTSHTYDIDYDFINNYCDNSELYSFFQKTISISQGSTLFKKLENNTYFRLPFEALIEENSVINFDDNKTEEELTAHEISIKSSEYILYNLHYLTPPPINSGGLLIIVNPGRTLTLYEADKIRLDNISLKIMENWRESNSNYFKLDWIFEHPNEFKPDGNGQQNCLTKKCFLILKEYKSLCNDISKARAPKDIRELFKQSISRIASYLKINRRMRNTIINLVNDFTFTEESLFQISGYRDHFYHQYMVFIYGVIFLLRLPDTIFNNCFFSDVSEFKEDDCNQILIAWFLISMFHDYGYAVEKIEDLSINIIKTNTPLHDFLIKADQLKKETSITNQKEHQVFKKLTESNNTKKLKELIRVNFEDLGLFLGDIYTKCFYSISKYFSKVVNSSSDANNFISFVFSRLIQSASSRNHGVLSAGIVFHNFAQYEYIHQFLPQICTSIAFHHRFFDNPLYSYSFPNNSQWAVNTENQWLDLTEWENIIKFEYAPLVALLMLCDSIQDWGRVSFDEGEIKPIPDLINVDFVPLNKCNNCSISSCKFKNENLILKIELKYKTFSNCNEKQFKIKCSEIVKSFARIKSDLFIIGINISTDDGSMGKEICTCQSFNELEENEMLAKA